MAGSSNERRRASKLMPIGEHRQAKVCDSFGLDDAAMAAAHDKPSSGFGRKVMRPLAKLKKAFVEMMVSEQGAPGSARNGTSSVTSAYTPAYGPAYCMGMGMAPIGADYGATMYFRGYS